MPITRYRDVADMPPAMLGGEDMTAAEGLRLACQLSVIAQRFAGPAARRRGVHPHPSLTPERQQGGRSER